MFYGSKNQPYRAISELRKATELAPDSARFWYNLGGAYFTVKNYDSARIAWNMTLKLNPGYIEAQRGLQALPQSNNQNP